MNTLLSLFAPAISQLLELAAHIGIEMLPEIKADAEAIVGTLFKIAIAYVTLQMSGPEAKDSLLIMVDTLKAQGDTLLGKLEVEAEKLPSEFIGILASTLGAIPGAILKLL